MNVLVSLRKKPNLALMKLSTKLKAQGEDVSLIELEDQFPLEYYLNPPKAAYISVVFSWNIPKAQQFAKTFRQCGSMDYIGGPAFLEKSQMSRELDETPPDYSIYPKVDYSYLLTSRGCPNNCSFCYIRRIEPSSYVLDNWRNHFRRGSFHALIIDSNFLAQPIDHIKSVISHLKENKILVDFNQGLDPKLIDERSIKILKQAKWSVIRTAFDELAEENEVQNAIRLIRENITNNHRNIRVYCLIGFKETFEQDLYRIQKIIEWGASPYTMRYTSRIEKKKDYPQNIINLYRWASRAQLWKSMPFEEYNEHYRQKALT